MSSNERFLAEQVLALQKENSDLRAALRFAWDEIRARNAVMPPSPRQFSLLHGEIAEEEVH